MFLTATELWWLEKRDAAEEKEQEEVIELLS
jgi:hypothetical protein